MTAGIIERPALTDGARPRPVKTEPGFVERVADKATYYVKKGWNGFMSGLRWLRDKAVAAYEWTRDRVVKPAWSKSQDARRWLWDVAQMSGAYLKDAVVGAWEFSAPFRAWVATPFRMAFGTSAGLIALLFFGGKVIVLLALIWTMYLLVSGRMQIVEKREKSGLNSIAPQDTRELEPQQKGALVTRLEELKARGDTSNDKNMASEYSGRVYLAEQRLAGSTETVNQLAALHREGEEKNLGVDQAQEFFTWTAVKRGMTAEDKVVRGILLATATPIMSQDA